MSVGAPRTGRRPQRPRCCRPDGNPYPRASLVHQGCDPEVFSEVATGRRVEADNAPGAATLHVTDTKAVAVQIELAREIEHGNVEELAMKLIVDRNRCEGHGLCTDAAPSAEAAARRWRIWQEAGRRTVALAVLAVAVTALTGTRNAAAAPAELAPKSSQRTTFDGWTLTIALSGEVVNAVPNLAGAQNSREGFVTLSAQANVDGAGSNPVTSGNFVAGYQVGCQIDVSQGLQIGGTGQLIGSAGATVNPAPGVQLGGTGAIGGFMQTNLQPGVITAIPMGSMALTTRVGHLDMQDVHLKIDACGGPVTIRSYASVAIATDASQTQLSVYGDPYVLS